MRWWDHGPQAAQSPYLQGIPDRSGSVSETGTNWEVTDNLTPLRRFSHRLKTHGRWRVRRLDDGALHWTSPHGFEFRVDRNGTHRITDETPV